MQPNEANVEKLRDRLRKLMALRDDEGATPEEAQVAALRVRELLLKLNLKEEDVPQEQQMPIVYDTCAWIEDKPSEWEKLLAGAVSQLTLCFCVTTKTHVHFVGTTINSATAAFLWSQLAYRLQATSEAARDQFVQEYKKKTGKSAWTTLGQARIKKWQRDWLWGAAIGVNDKVVESQKQDVAATTALVVRKLDDARAAAEATFGALHSTKFRARRIGTAFEKGREVGKAIELRKGLSDNPSPELE